MGKGENAPVQTAIPTLPDPDVMYGAIVQRDATLIGAFVVAVRTTGIFCRPGCPARVPKRQNVEFFRDGKEALFAGYRACLRCKPLEGPEGAAPPEWVQRLMRAVERDNQARLTARDLRAMGIDPARSARWFKAHHGLTFAAYQRARRVGRAVRRLREGGTMTSATMVGGYASESGLREAFEALFGAPDVAGTNRGKNVRGKNQRGKNTRGKDTREMAPTLRARWIVSPLGPLLAVASENAVVFLEFVDRRAMEAQVAALRARFGVPVLPAPPDGANVSGPEREAIAVLVFLEAQLKSYFEGKLTSFSVPVDAPGTPFQQRVWAQLRAIPHGQTRSYLDVAKALGRPTATRAVARANGDNRIAILIPCHRVIGSDGTLTGYGGGLWRKESLLRLEGARL